jgi:antitoxin MazE
MRLLDATFLALYLIVETQGGARMHVRVQKWGNSLAVRIPKPLAEDAEVKEGTVLNLAVSDGKVVATPIARRKLSLKQMLAKVTRQNLHAEVDSGPSVEREIW